MRAGGASMSGSADLVVRASVDEVLRIIPAGCSEGQRQRFDDLRCESRGFLLTLLATIPAGPRRDDALLAFRRCVTAAVLGIMS